MYILTIVSGLVRVLHLKDTKVALSLATLFLWLLMSLASATFHAAWVADDFNKTGTLLESKAELVRNKRNQHFRPLSRELRRSDTDLLLILKNAQTTMDKLSRDMWKHIVTPLTRRGEPYI